MYCQMCPLPVALQLWAPLHGTAGPTTFPASGHGHLPQLPKFLLPCPRNALLGYKPLNTLNTQQISCWLFNMNRTGFFFSSKIHVKNPFYVSAMVLQIRGCSFTAVLQLGTGQLSHSGSPARSRSLPLQAQQHFSASPETIRFFFYAYPGQGKGTAPRPMAVTEH